jgi:O-antigen/teichoic acid export membrane protein
MKDLKEKTIRGGLARIIAQGVNFALRTGSLMVLARLLEPKDFGLVGMVTAFTGVLSLFRDFGLSSAAIQRETVTEKQVSTLFWMNLSMGAILALLAVCVAPAIAGFYHEPRLFAVTAVLAAGFLFNGAGVQHGALLQRQMRFTTLAIINTVALVLGTAIAIGGALVGYGYWSLVAMSVASPLVTTIGCWLASGWVPGKAHRQSGIRSMLRFGGGITLYGLMGYVMTNFEKVLLGRFWGVDALGLYGRAYQLINIPTENLNSAAGEVAFSALSRVQNEPARLKNYFLKGYALVLAMTVPPTIACALFANDMIAVLLGPKWHDAAPIFRLLAPTVLVFAIINPLSWLLCSVGRVRRLLKMSLVIMPLMIGGYFVGLPYGPKGVASAYSAVMLLWVIPALAWGVHDTGITLWDVLRVVRWPLVSGAVAAVLAVGTRSVCSHSLSVLTLLILEMAVITGAYVCVLFFATGQRSFYLEILRGLRPSSIKTKELVSA